MGSRFCQAEEDQSDSRQTDPRVFRPHGRRDVGGYHQDRGSQITFSALGQQAPLEEKKKWDPDFAKRKKIKAILDKLIPEFSVRMGGATSVDITKTGEARSHFRRWVSRRPWKKRRNGIPILPSGRRSKRFSTN